MRVNLTSTSKVVDLDTGHGTVPARVWEGRTESGIYVQAFITRIAARRTEDLRQFEDELFEQATPSTEVLAIPARLIL